MISKESTNRLFISLTLIFPPRSLTDTSYFPTEDLNDVPEQPVGAEASSGSKDLAFLGYTVRENSRCTTFPIN